MKKALLKLTSVIIVVVMLMAMMVPMLPASAAFNYKKGRNDVSSSYQSGRYYRHLQNIELTGDGVTDVLAVALSQLGYSESASNNNLSGESAGDGNHTEYNWNMGDIEGNGYKMEWCASFCSWSLLQGGATTHNSWSQSCRENPTNPEYIWREVGCPPWVTSLKNAGLYGTRGNYTPKSGDLIFFNRGDRVGHIGLVVWCDGSTVYTIEGNTSPGNGIVVGNGGGVYYKSYALTNEGINGYGKLSQKYKTADVPKVDYSGANKTPGWYIVKTGNSVGSIPAHHMFKVLNISGDSATVEYGGSTQTVSLSGLSSALQITASGGGASSPSSDFKFGLTDKGVTVNEDGTWSVEMYLEGADSRFKYDAWYGIYDLGVTPKSSADSQGAWGYVVPEADDVRDAAFESGENIPSKRFTFTFNSSDLEKNPPKGNPTVGGTYNLFLFYTDDIGTSNSQIRYEVARSFPITISAQPTTTADYEHVVVIGVDGAGTFFKNTSTPNIDTIFENGAVTYSAHTEEPSMSAENWASMLHGVSSAVHGLDNDIAKSKPFTNSAYPSIFKVLREKYPSAKLGSFSHWAPINTGIIEDGIGVDKTHDLSDAQIAAKTVEYVKANDPKFVFVQFDEADEIGHNIGYDIPQQHEKITELDGYIGQIYKAYKDKGLLEKTLFIVTSDHGGIGRGHGEDNDAETHVMFAAVGKTVRNGGIGSMMIRDTAAIVLDALGCQIPDIYTSSVPQNLYKGLEFGVSDVRVNGSSYEIEMYVEGADNRFGHDAWIGIYDGDVTAEELYVQGSAISQGAWDYVAQGSGKHTTSLSAGTRLGAGRRTFTFKSSDLDSDKSNHPAVGGTYTIFLFYTDGHDGNAYVVADSVGVTIKGDDGVNFGLSDNGIAVRPDGSWSMEMYLEGADSSYEYDTWFGVYDADVSAEELLSGGSSLSQGTWGYVKPQTDQNSLNSGKYVFWFDSNNCDKSKVNPVPGKTYNVFLFKNDRNNTGTQYKAVASFPLHIPSAANTGDVYFRFGFNKGNAVSVNTDGSWTLNMFIDGADSRFDDNAWVGIYNTDVTKEQLLADGGELSQGSWTDIGDFDSSRTDFRFTSSMITSDKGPKLGGSYNAVLFYSDSEPNGYVVARMIPFTLPTIGGNVQFGLTDNGVKVNSDGTWSVEMYLEGADGRFQYDTWFGIYDSTVTAEAIKNGKGDISQGAWGYVVPNGENIHETKLSAGTNIGSDRIVFSFNSNQLVGPVDGKSNPAPGGTYNIFLFCTDSGSEQYTVVKTITVELDPNASSNDGENDGTHRHSFDTVKNDNKHHWGECECGELDRKVAHAMRDGKCVVCGYTLNISDDAEDVPDDGNNEDIGDTGNNGNVGDNENNGETNKPSDSNKPNDNVDKPNGNKPNDNESNDDTDNKATDEVTKDTEPKKKNGCKSAIAASAVVVTTVFALGLGFKKKED